MNADKWIQTALDCGAAKAALIEQEQIVLSAEFRKICKSNGCGNYGLCWMCPPDVGDIETLMAQARSFPHALLYQTVHTLEDSYDIEGMTAGAMAHAQVSQRLQAALQARGCGATLHLTCGGCRLCDMCAKRDGQPCRFPERALPSMESYGVDVYNTAKGTELKYINGVNTVTFFGMVEFAEA